MAMVCPRCNRPFEQQLNCPECGGRLLFQANTKGLTPEDSSAGETSQWQQTPWGRLAVGLILAQGLAYGLQQFLTAGVLATGEQSPVWTTLWGIVLLHGIQGGCLLIGGAMCGAGKQRGILYGSIIGLVNGFVFLLVQRHSDGTPTAIAMYGQPIMHMAFGALGGLIGMLIWKPLPRILIPEGAGAAKVVALPAPTFQFLDGPIYLGRVCLGIFVVVNGIVWSNAVLNWVMHASQGALEIRTHLQSQLISWEVCGLATLVGAGLAGASTFNGLKQGLCVGIGSSLILAGVQLGNPKFLLETTVLMILGIMIMTIAGGWFGSQLFPPLQARKRRNRILAG
jgi:DNA-directed RNA polymerase subunit RPC12/RpoP